MASNLSLQTLQIHADDSLARESDVSAPINVTTTYRYAEDPDKLYNSHHDKYSAGYDNEPVYARIGFPANSRAEQVLGTVLSGKAVTYASGIAAFNAALAHYNPKTVFIGEGYHGCHGALKILQRNHGVKVLPLDSDPNLLQKGDLVHLETPVNPKGLHLDIAKYAKIAHSRQAFLLIDATLAPPPLFQPFDFGADMVLHSATKYLAGHSDVLAGVLVTRDESVQKQLLVDRIYLGATLGSLEAWLLLRSLRTYSLRIRAQYEGAHKVIQYLVDHLGELPKLKEVYHANLQHDEYVKHQLPLGGGPVFSIEVADKDIARNLPSKLRLFHHATSLGGVESLIEWRSMSDNTVSETLLRVSIGAENPVDLINDLKNALS